MPEILVFEPGAGGHRMHHVLRIVEGISRLKLGPVRLLTTPKALEHDATQAVIASKACNIIDTVTVEGVSPRLPYKLYWLTAWQYQATKALEGYVYAVGGPSRFRLLFIPFIDSTSLAPLALGRYPFSALPFSGIVINPTYHLRRSGVRAPRRAKHIPEWFLYKRLLAHPRLHSLFSIDPFFVQNTKSSRVLYVPDPAEFSNSKRSGVRQCLGIPEDAVVVLLYGVIDRRKGFAQLIRAIARTPPQLNVVLLAAGVQDQGSIGRLPEPETTQLRLSRRLVEVCRFITPEEERAVFDTADIVWVCYSRSTLMSSGVMVKAGQAGKPVISNLNGVCAAMVRMHRVGMTADTDDIAGLAEVIRVLACAPTLRQQLGEAGRRVFREHTYDHFLEPIFNSIRSLPLQTSIPTGLN